MTNKFDQLRMATETILKPDVSASSLRPEVVEIATILADSQTASHVSQPNIAEGESRTPNGLALSPTMAATCANDFVRTIAFIRGTNDVIVDVREHITDRPARVLYIGCGPLATLAVPLMSIFSPDEVTFTLLDIHPESITSARSIVDSLGLNESVSVFETMDAGTYCVSVDEPPDIVLAEVMQACLEAEPQVAIMRHLFSQIPNAIFVPEQISIELKLVDPSREFEFQNSTQNGEEAGPDRIPVGPVFVVNQTSVASWTNISDDWLPGSQIKIPETFDSRYMPMLFTEICTYKEHRLSDYDSGLTCPRALTTAIQAGDVIQFQYELGQKPGLRSTVCP